MALTSLKEHKANLRDDSELKTLVGDRLRGFFAALDEQFPDNYGRWCESTRVLQEKAEASAKKFANSDVRLREQLRIRICHVLGIADTE